MYRIQASIDGPSSAYGIDGFDEEYCAGVTFNFVNESVSHLEERPGQIPEVLFIVKERVNEL